MRPEYSPLHLRDVTCSRETWVQCLLVRVHAETPFHGTLWTFFSPALTDDCIPLLAITDATCVVHFSFPSSPKVFGGRLYCMSDHFQSLAEQVWSIFIIFLVPLCVCQCVGKFRAYKALLSKIRLVWMICLFYSSPILRVLQQSREIKEPNLSCCWRREMQATLLVSCDTWSEQMPKFHQSCMSLLLGSWKPKKIRRPEDRFVHILRLLDFASKPILFKIE